jgi:AcrR family transcriptional regulator
MQSNQNRALRRDDWLLAGLDALATHGPQSLRAAKLARTLGVTTGSFYWHFDSVDVFRAELLVYWKEEVVERLISEARAASDDPSQVLAEIRKRILESGAHRYDSAMRRWAGTDDCVLETVRRADEVRGAFLTDMLRASGVNAAEARERASLIGAAWRGSVDDPGGPDSRMQLIRLASGK